MGLAASQARLLSITQRISDNELRAQLINNQKMRLNSESSRVSENYINALNKTNLVFANYNSEDEAQNVPLTFKNLTAFNQYNNQYNLTNTAGNVLISEDDARKYTEANGNLENFLKDGYGIEYTTSYWDTIGDQLHKCEAYYSTPNLNGDVDSGDGSYAFFEANQLQEMYEGGNGIPSYADTVKTSNYTDFVNCYDTFFDELASYRNATYNFGPTVNVLANQIISNSGYIISANDITVNTDGTLSTNKTYAFTTNDIFETAATVNLSDYMPANITELGFTNNNGTYTKTLDETWDNITNNDYITGYNTTNANAESYKYLTMTTGSGTNNETTYIQIALTDENSGDTTSYWYNLSNDNIYKLAKNNFSQQYELTQVTTISETYSDTDNDNNQYTETVTISIEKINDSLKKTTTSTVAYNSGNTVTYTDTIFFAIPQNETDYEDGPKIEITNLNDSSQLDLIKELVVDYMNTTGLENIIIDQINNGNKVVYSNLTSTQLDILNNPPNNTKSNELIAKMNELLGFTNNPVSDAAEMEAILNALTSGTGLTPKSSGFGFTLTYTYTDSNGTQNTNTKDITSDAAKLTNAIVCDTLMDYFGEPVYGYMKKDASGDWVVADEEAQWYINLFNKIQSCGYQVLANGLANSTEWLQFALENGIVVMEQINSEQNWQPITHTSCSDIIEQADTQAATLAEAEYNKAMRQIEAKDEIYDLELKNIDTEHSSLEAEYESVKKAMTGNIERTFQMYG